MMRRAVAILLALAGPAAAHSWYPPSCCSERDCELAGGVKRDDAKGEWVMPNGERVPYGATQPTPDGVQGIHWCRSLATGRVIWQGAKACVFTPAAGG
jgi:hypothetical protein